MGLVPETWLLEQPTAISAPIIRVAKIIFEKYLRILFIFNPIGLIIIAGSPYGIKKF